MNGIKFTGLTTVMGVPLLIFGVFWLGLVVGRQAALKTYLEPIVFEVDGIRCSIAEEPVLTYYASTDTVRVNIECDGLLLDYYRPAMVIEVEE